MTPSKFELLEANLANTRPAASTCWTLLGDAPNTTATVWRPVLFGKKLGGVDQNGTNPTFWLKERSRPHE